MLVSLALLFLQEFSWSSTPEGFVWVSPESGNATMAKIRRSLPDPSITLIRKVGLEQNFALVFAISGVRGAPTRAGDLWSIYNVSLATGKSRILVSGYGVKLIGWIGSTGSEVAITYYDCWECEAATLFTTLHLDPGTGWTARWVPSKHPDSPHPGAVMLLGDVGAPYDDNEVDQVFAIVPQPNKSFAAGSWFHSRDRKTGKTDEDVVRYAIDPLTGKDLVEELSGPAALGWKREVCTASNTLTKLSVGQNSKACRLIRKETRARRATP